MTNKQLIALMVSVGLGVPAMADVPKANHAASQADKTSQLTAEMPKPAPEIGEMAKMMTGTWRCKGSGWMADGTEHEMTGTLKSRLDLDGFWVHDTWDGKLENHGYRFEMFTTYDPSARQARRVMVDSQGSQLAGTADTMRDRKMDFVMTGTGPGGAIAIREHLDASDPKVGVRVTGERSTDNGKTWQNAYELSCVK